MNRPDRAWHGRQLKVIGVEEVEDMFQTGKHYKLDADGSGSVILREDEVTDVRPHFPGHFGHEIVENHAGGKMFLYCRKCKVEVP